jgi:predicted enzyme related to lactoylglutathione lyase
MADTPHGEGVGTLYAFVVDVNELEACARFWSQVLGVEVLYQDETYVRLGRREERPTLLLQKVSERHGDKNRAHIDLDVTDLDAAVSRVQELGGRSLRTVHEYAISWVVMADPDGNEFCLIKHS